MEKAMNWVHTIDGNEKKTNFANEWMIMVIYVEMIRFNQIQIRALTFNSWPLLNYAAIHVSILIWCDETHDTRYHQ